jgi:hypothetical protein
MSARHHLKVHRDIVKTCNITQLKCRKKWRQETLETTAARDRSRSASLFAETLRRDGNRTSRRSVDIVSAKKVKASRATDDESPIT